MNLQIHRKVFGRWEARIEFYKDDVTNGIGRIIIPFEMTVDDDDFVAEQQQDSQSKSQSQEEEGSSGSRVAVVSVEKKE